jgi:hypothetical protein
MLDLIGRAKRINNVKIAWEIVEKAGCSNGGFLIAPFHFVKAGSTLEILK